MEGVGRSLTLTDRIDPARVAALHATLERPGPAPAEGDPLPPFWHWAQFWDIQSMAALGRDGHPRPGAFIPDTGLPRRMWAGGRLSWTGLPLAVGEVVTRRTTIAAAERKEGRSGPLAFITLRHSYAGAAGEALVEEQDLVYRPDPQPGDAVATPRPAPVDETLRRDLGASTATLFRYSALTFNAHRIHYDLPYARDVEGYPDLVVHGPLMAQHLIHLAHDSLPHLARFSFRGAAPVFQPDRFTACARPEGAGLALWIRTATGGLAMTAEAG